MKKLTPEIWNAQYAKGKWNHLLQEEKRNNVIGELCRKYHLSPSVLDVGCGFGNLIQHLSYQRYLGIDFSETALKYGNQRLHPQATFLGVDAEQFQTVEKFDLIIFNEILYYVDTMALLERYTHFLAPSGLFIISMWKHPKTILLWEEIERKYNCLEQVEVQEGEDQWKIEVVRINDNNLNK